MDKEWMKASLHAADKTREEERRATMDEQERREQCESGVDEYFAQLVAALKAKVAEWNADDRNGPGDLSVSPWEGGWMIRRARMPGGSVVVTLGKPQGQIVCTYAYERSALADPVRTKRKNFPIARHDNTWRLQGSPSESMGYAVEKILSPLMKGIVENRSGFEGT
jgi:hypothetical protein